MLDPVADAAYTMASIQKASTALASDFAQITDSTNVQLHTMAQVLNRMLEVYRDGMQGFLKAVDEMAAHGAVVVGEVDKLNAQLIEMQLLAERIKTTVGAVDQLTAAVAALVLRHNESS